MRWLIVLFLAASCLSADDDLKFFLFMQVASHYERKLLGCPEHAYDSVQCSPAQGVNDVKLRAEVWKRGRELFARGD